MSDEIEKGTEGQPKPALFPLDPIIAGPILDAWMEEADLEENGALEKAEKRFESKNKRLHEWFMNAYRFILNFKPEDRAACEVIAEVHYFTGITLYEVISRVADSMKIQVPVVYRRDIEQSLKMGLGPLALGKPKIGSSPEVASHALAIMTGQLTTQDNFLQVILAKSELHFPNIFASGDKASGESTRLIRNPGVLHLYRPLRNVHDRSFGNKK